PLEDSLSYFAGAGWPRAEFSAGLAPGGIVSPPDAVAAASVMKGMNLPRRVLAILEGESLVNDASGLIVIQFATAAVVSGSFALGQASLGLSRRVFGRGPAAGLRHVEHPRVRVQRGRVHAHRPGAA
nr:hypothetical protein [Tanacetum cinerariifolium]